MNNNLIKLTTALIFLMMLFGCNIEDILEEKPPHLITTETLYTSMSGFETGINSLYARVRMEREGGNNHFGEMFQSGTDVLVSNSANRANMSMTFQFWDDLNSQHPRIYQRFSWLYEVVNGANTIINQAEEKDDVDWSGSAGSADENKNMIIAEARALRAWAYRHLTFGWGDVPLSLKESLGSTIKTDWERTPVARVRRQIISDLMFAEKHIPIEPKYRGSLTKGAVQHYLSEMYLTIDKPDSALFWANKVINTPDYKLITERYGVLLNETDRPVYMDQFLDGNTNRDEGNTEALWVFQFEYGIPGGGQSSHSSIHMSRIEDIVVDGVRPFRATLERGGGRKDTRAQIPNYYLILFEEQDDRYSHYAIRKFYILKDAEANAPFAADRLPPGYQYGDTIWTHGVNDPDLSPTNRVNVLRPFLRKVDGTTKYSTDPITSRWDYKDQPYLRLAETYMLKAEAEYKLNRPNDAAETLNVIRRRSNASEITAAEIDIDFILDERARELTMEEHRRWTLLRTGKWLERTRLYNHNGGQFINETFLLYPIPQPVIDANLTGDMPQNPGYN